MSIKLEMLRAASRAPRLLPDLRSLAPLVLQFRGPEGGYRSRGGQCDLYYTAFGMQCALALGLPAVDDKLLAYLRTFGSGGELDFVHLCCLARCGSLTGSAFPQPLRDEILQQADKFRCRDGGYNLLAGMAHGSAYGAFLAVSLVQDLCLPDEKIDAPVSRLAPPPLLAPAHPAFHRLDGVVASLAHLANDDGSFSNDREFPLPSTAATAAAVTVLRHLGQPVDADSLNWLLSQICPDGGFAPFAASGGSDLLSTAIAVHALAASGIEISPIRRSVLSFVRDLWSPAHGFLAAADQVASDCEYIFYGLLAMGHLA